MGRVMGSPRPRIRTRKLSSTQTQVLVGYLLRYQSEFTELAESRFLDCDSCGMTQYVADSQAMYTTTKQTRSDTTAHDNS